MTAITFVAFLLACGGSPPSGPRPSSTFTDAHARIFEDGADYIDSQTALEGRWRDDWDRDTEARVSEADIIALVLVETIRVDTDLDRRTTMRVVATVRSVLYGERPGDQVALVVREGEPGFGTIQEGRLMNREFVAFMKWYEAEEAQVLAHWHLSPASEDVLAHVRGLVERRRRAPPARGARAANGPR